MNNSAALLRRVALRYTPAPVIGLFAASMILALASPPAHAGCEQAKLVANDFAHSSLFGIAVSLDGDTALVGDYLRGSLSGSAYVFVRAGTAWSQQAKLVASDAKHGRAFGFSVAVGGDDALVGSILDPDVGGGSVYWFERSGSTWVQQDKFKPSGAEGGAFGISISIDGKIALVGASRGVNDVGHETGSVSVLRLLGGSLVEESKLTAGDGAAADLFGASVFLDGDTALVGAVGDDDAGESSGSAYVFVRAGTAWSQQAKLTASDGAAGDAFGVSVSLDGDTALVGASLDDHADPEMGSAYVFVRNGSTWSQQAKLTAADGAAMNFFGDSVSIDEDTAVVGAIGNGEEEINAGAVYVYVRSGNAWTQQRKLTAGDAESDRMLGDSVSLRGDTALVGAPTDVNAGLRSGSAYMFDVTSPIELLRDLIQTTMDLNIQRGIENSLDMKLAAVLHALEDINTENDAAAANALEAFIISVQAQRGGPVAQEDADTLIAAAQEIIVLLGC